jgi:hypothetical protein
MTSNNRKKRRKINVGSRARSSDKYFTIDQELYDRLLVDQNERCAICQRHQRDLNAQLCVDHCHKTLKVRGLLCKKCNLGLGYFNDNINLILQTIDYLRYSPSTDYLE